MTAASARTAQQISSAVGHPVRAWRWADGCPFYEFAYTDPAAPDGHVHGWWHRLTGAWGVETPVQTVHRADCATGWPGHTDSRAAALAGSP